MGNAHPITKKEELFKNMAALPKNWKLAKLTDIGEFKFGGTPSKRNSSYWNGNVPFVTGADITSFYVSGKNARAFLTTEGFNSGKTAVCNPGTILLVTRTRVGRVGIASETMGASQDLSPYNCGSDALPEYVCRYLRTLSNYLMSQCRGSTILGLTREIVQNLEIPLPPIEEQRRIAAILDQADGVRRKRQEAIRLTEELLRATFLDMFGDLFAFLRPLEHESPKGFKLCKLQDQIKLQRGFDLLKKDCIDGEYPVISSGGIYTYHREYKAIGPGVLLGRKGSVGRVHYIETNYWPHDTTLWVKEFNGNHAAFVFYFFKLFPISKFEESTANPTLNRNRLHPLNVFWPPYELQLKFANFFDVYSKNKAKLKTSLSTMDNMFNSLLQRAFRGEL
ncbi:MAG: restriction endonuclease subunit S [Spirulina sp. DLM2.Bin59]|nr:MAG: restriction endonuclease subunit S [Spirulina sp. DLM2.Bin59]